VKVSGRRVEEDLRIVIRNPLAPDHARKQGGNKMAMANIQQRFELAYGNKASVEVEETDSAYIVSLQFPCDEGAL
jgi:two-component system sensor histidine kinase AlgZ